MVSRKAAKPAKNGVNDMFPFLNRLIPEKETFALAEGQPPLLMLTFFACFASLREINGFRFSLRSLRLGVMRPVAGAVR